MGTNLNLGDALKKRLFESNVNLSDVLKKIASDAGFISSAGNKFAEGESLEVLFVSGGSNKSDTVVLKDTSGDNYSISAQSLQGFLSDDEYNALINGGANKTEDASATKGATEIVLDGAVEEVEKTEATSETKDTSAIQDEIDALETQREANQKSMETLKDQIEDLKEQIEQSIQDALAAMEEIEEEQKKKAEEVVAEELKKFQESNGAMSQDEFSSNVKSALAAINPSMGEALTYIMSADNNMALMSNLLNQLSQKIDIDKQLGDQIDGKEQELEAAKAAAEAAKSAASSSSCRPCDPIGANFGENLGFDLDGDGDAGQIQIDFFYDEDGDGKINSMNDFVGAKSDASGADGWDEMSAMDVDGDGTISDDELANNNVKVMITEVDDDGTKSQRALSIEEFTEQVGKGDLEISTQKHDEINNNVVGPFGFSDNDSNQMLGTFDIGFSEDDSVDTIGYQTLDDQNWLVENYSDNMDIESLKAEGVDVSAVESANAEEAGELSQFEEFVKQYQDEVMPQLQTEINDAYAQLGLTQESISIFKDLAEATAELEGTKIANKLEEQEKQATQKAEEQEEQADEAEEAAEEQQTQQVDAQEEAEQEILEEKKLEDE